ncbi:hypothetical protein BSF38_00081 [Paludisphaera borealis]|uniref:Uncharacterized protein n=1 Tax=Paludisphaera borealis TaxID=1387353 RepID=A0A1U7CIC3_9BACT|nr:hypothetical protein BSF38_00081 [Paludisphaera borealis]
MTTPDNPELIRGLAALDAGRYADAYVILRPLANAGNLTAQARLGGIVSLGMHRFSDWDAYQAWPDSASPDQIADYLSRYAQEDRELAAAWLQSASDGGDAYASHCLAMLFVTGVSEEGWEVRRKKVLELVAKAQSQGFDCVDYGDPPGEAYLQFLERDAALHKRYAARHPDEA